MESAKIFVLGASGWIGYCAVDYMERHCPQVEIIGTYRRAHPYTTRSKVRLFSIEKNADALSLIEKTRPQHVLNLSRGETDADFAFHQEMIALSNMNGFLYGFASSFNACDNQLQKEHYEQDLPDAQSDYGKFKARCELELNAQAKQYCIFRFGATHGWAPNKEVRTEAFLKKLRQGQEVRVNRGILQNRTFVGELGAMMVDVLLNEGRGVFHLGAVDNSDEVNFLRELAVRFGYSQHKVTEGELIPTNAIMVPKKLFELTGDKWRRTEAQVLAAVSQQPELAKYRRV